jgi:hypothetical protein
MLKQAPGSPPAWTSSWIRPPKGFARLRKASQSFARRIILTYSGRAVGIPNAVVG